MAGNSALQAVQERGWQRGLGNLMRAGFASWWRTNNGWLNALIWTGVINFLLGAVIWSAESVEGLPDVVNLLGVFMGLFPAVAVIIIMQGAIVGEKQSGTAAWVLSKPVSRASFILSKLVPNAVGFLVTMVLAPGMVAYIQFALGTQGDLVLGNFVLGLLVLWLNLLFYLALTVFLGALFDSWGVVIAIPLGFLFGQQWFAGLAPGVARVLPWSMVVMFPGTEISLAGAVMQGIQPPTYAPIYFALACTAILVAAAFWAFERQEF